MPERRHVTQRDDGKWQEKPEGATRAGSVHDTQREAQQAATEKLRNTPGGGEVVIHRPSGPIRNSNTINRPDPNPPKDKKH